MLKKFSCAMVLALAMVMAVGSLPAFAGGYGYTGHPGDLLLGYVYDLRDEPTRDASTWENFLVFQNTTNKWVAAHLRFRSYMKSIEVWDHIVLLSPYDVFWVDLTRKAGGGVTLYSADTETLLNSGIIKSGTDYSADFSTQLLADCGYTEDLAAETEAGEVEVIGLWQINSTSHSLASVLKSSSLFDESNADVNGDGVVNALDVLAAVWENADTPANQANGSRLTGNVEYLEDCGNHLLGSMELGDIVTGQYMLYNLEAMQDFRTDGPPHRDLYPYGAILYPEDLLYGRNYFSYIYQAPAYYYNADWATTTGPTLRDGDAILGPGEPACPGVDLFNQAWSMIDVEDRFAVDDVWGFYMEGAFNSNIMTDAVLSFPTKYLHYLYIKVGEDCDDTDLLPGGPDASKQWPYFYGQAVGSYNDSVIKYRKAIKAQWDSVANGPVLLQTFDIWDTEQNKPQAISGPSPHPLFDVRIPHEVNVMNVVNDIFAPIFEGADETPFEAGQFVLGGFVFNGQQRDYNYNGYFPWFEYAENGADCVLGATMRIHEMPASALFRSTMAPLQWDYVPHNDF